MKKLNNKGITLAELIVSFAIVSVAVIYMYQTLLTINKMYSKAKTDITEFSKATFALRMADRLIEAGGKSYKDEDNEWSFNISDPIPAGKYKYYNVIIDGKTYKLYKYVN